MQNFILKMRQFMQGRNGIDKLTTGLVVIYAFFSFVLIFLKFAPVAYIIVSVIRYAILAYALFRILSRNLQKRYNENFRFEQMISGWKPYFERTKLRLQYIKTHRFRKCNGCGEFLRFKKGNRKKTAVCPKCGKESTFHFLF